MMENKKSRHCKVVKLLIITLLSLSVADAQTVVPTQTDEIIIDNGTTGTAGPGDQIRYKVTIQNTAVSGDGTGTQLNIVPDPRTTFQPGTFRSTPLAVSDAYACTGNVGINIPAASGVKTNDFDDNTAGLSVTAGTFVTTQGGSIMLASDGSFMYTPPAGFTGTDTYVYTLVDGNDIDGAGPIPGTDAGTISITVSNMIWFVDNSVAGPGTGTLSDPFKTLASAATASAVNQVIFIKNTGSNYTSGINLKNGQYLFATGHTGGSNLADAGVLPFTIAPNSKPLPAINGTRPVIVNSGGDGVGIAQNNTLRGFNIGDCSDYGIESTNGSVAMMNLTIRDMTIDNNTGGGLAMSGFGGNMDAILDGISSNGNVYGIALFRCTGTFTVNGGTLRNATFMCVRIESPSVNTVNFTYSGNITTSVAYVAGISRRTGGAVIFQTGNISSTAQGINIESCSGGTVSFNNPSITLNYAGSAGITLINNTGCTMNFGGTLTISTQNSYSAFSATGGGTVNVTGTASSISSTAATTLNITSTTIGAGGVTFQSISSGSTSKGITLNATGSGAFMVTGTGATDGSGGTIQNITTRGAEFISAQNITLKNMNFTNACTSDFPAAPTGLSLGNNTGDNACIHLQGTTNVILDNLNITNSAEQGINGHNVNGFILTNSVLSGLGNGADEDGLHFYNMVGTCSITNTSITSSGDDNVNIQNNTTPIAPPVAVGTITVSGGSFNTGVLGSGILFGIRGTSNTTIDITGVTINNNFSGGVVADCFDNATMDLEVATSTITNNNDAVSLSSHNGNTKFDIHNNSNISGQDAVNISILKSAFSTTGTLEGRIRNNMLTTENGHTADNIIVNNTGGNNLTVAITGNTIDYAGTQRAINIQGGQDGASIMSATVTGNTIDVKLDGTGNAQNAILANSQIADPSGAGSSLCVDIGGAGALANTITHSLGGTLAGGDIRVRQRFAANVRLPGYAGGPTDTAAVAAYLDGRNTEVSPSTASFLSGSFTGGAACTQPSN